MKRNRFLEKNVKNIETKNSHVHLDVRHINIVVSLKIDLSCDVCKKDKIWG
jgi:hypothetical protein